MPINNLPNELLVEIMRLLERSYWPRESQSLRSCCLVCRRWLRLGEPLLFEFVSPETCGELVEFHRHLTTSKRLRKYVRDWDMATNLGCSIAGCVDPGMASRLMADCLKKTTELETVSVNLDLSARAPSMTKLVLGGICQLQKLKYLAIDGFDGVNDSGTDIDSDLWPAIVQQLLDLPKTIKTLRIGTPTDDLIKLLPKICANLSSRQLTLTASNTEQAGQSVHTQNQTHHVTGLSCLVIWGAGRPTISPALGHALASTLTSLTYCNQRPPVDPSVMIGFLAETPLLERIFVNEISPVLFDGLLPLTQLRSLEIWFTRVPVQINGDDVCRALAQFLSQSPHFHSVTVHMPSDDSSFISHLIQALLDSTSLDGSISRLRVLELYALSAPSIDTFEYMCRSATMLEEIAVKVPTAPLSRVASALANLKQLVSARLGQAKSRYHDCESFERCNGEEAIDFFSKLSNMGWDL